MTYRLIGNYPESFTTVVMAYDSGYSYICTSFLLNVDIIAAIIVCMHFVTKESLAPHPSNLPFKIEPQPICPQVVNAKFPSTGNHCGHPRISRYDMC